MMKILLDVYETTFLVYEDTFLDDVNTFFNFL